MRKNIIFSVVYLVLLLLFSACGDKISPVPGAVTLLTPAETVGCLRSTSSSSTTYAVNFTWDAATDAESYQLDITDLDKLTTTSFITTNCSYRTTLPINAGYSWKVTAINSTAQTESSVWKFYLSGPATTNYAPYPADLTFPLNGTVVSANSASSVTINFQWTAGDPDNDIDSYSLYLDDKDGTTLVAEALTAVSSSQTLISGKTYYWKIVTKDKVGNSSTSSVSSFQIK